MPAPLLRRRWFRVLLGVTAIAVLVPTLVYVFGGPGAREAIDGFWRWFDGSLQRLQVMSWVVASAVAAVSYLGYLSDKRSKLLEYGRWAADKATEGDPQAANEIGRRALQDVKRTAQDAGEPVPEFVDAADVLSDAYQSKLLDEAATDEATPAVDDDQKGER
ncbi:hypothetical protein [Kocuria sabuli]|uniref:hypothetical protein n=1 Tax=Kocuria sabuli TaxID=3071448 RepID=UPI0034D5A320